MRNSADATFESERPPAPLAVSWRGTSRYEVVQRLGEGGMGVVYEAFDRERHQHVAVKTLLRFSPDALYRFKQEFRTLADVIHSNLVRLYDLVVSDGEDPFFTMELIRGTTFQEHVRPASQVSSPITNVATVGPRRDASPEPTLGSVTSPPSTAEYGAPRPRKSPADLARLRPALRQLAEGVHALHLAGKLHRDIKPSNVLVTPEGRVVLLDFGVATEIGREADLDEALVGTARYMAPEQATDDASTAASDWYSVGVMLYEALVGEVPFAGSVVDVLTRKSIMDPPAPHESAEGIPSDLDLLCSELLRREPSERPTGIEVLGRLGRPSAAASPLPLAQPTGQAPLVGRESQLRVLAEAFEAACQGDSVTVLVSGGPGMGKSALVRHFVEELASRDAATVLRGRVYQRETVPYKVFDSVIDALSRHLLHFVEHDQARTLPGDVSALARLFPVLNTVVGINSVQPTVLEPHLVRRRAFSALGALLTELRRERPLVLFIEDVHWGDRDSVGLLFEALRAPILFVLTCQDGAEGTSPFLDEMRARWPEGAERRDVSVGPLGGEDARALALSLLGSHRDETLQDAVVIARESGGSPFLVEELVRSALTHEWRGQSEAASGPPGGVTLEKMVRDRLTRLRAGTQRLLELVAVGGRPLETSLLLGAAGLKDEAEEAVSQLRSRRFVRTDFRGGRELIEISHGRIADTIIAQMSTEGVRERHGELALMLETLPGTDAEALAQHLLAAGHEVRAVEWAERAADDASSKLAFEQAVRLYKLAIRMRTAIDPTSTDLQRLRMRLGEVDAQLSSAELEGPLKEHVNELVRMEREIEEAEQRIAQLRGKMGTSMAPSLLAQIDELEAELALARARFQEAVVDLPLDTPSSGVV